tara:strand:- start:243 stop:455 length:213 start_codon:yes stop_codon:yes gene_type:complete
MSKFVNIISSFGIVLAISGAAQSADDQELIDDRNEKATPSLYYQEITPFDSDEESTDSAGSNGVCYNGSC